MRTPVDAAHEIATTRTAHEEDWHSKWAAIVVAILVSMAVALFAHVPWLFRKTSTALGIGVGVASVLTLVIGVCAFDSHGTEQLGASRPSGRRERPNSARRPFNVCFARSVRERRRRRGPAGALPRACS